METEKDISPASGKYLPHKRKNSQRMRFYKALILLFALTFSKKKESPHSIVKSKI